MLTRAEGEHLAQAVVDRVVRLGPLEPLLTDPMITEIMVNDPAHVFIERDGRIEPCPAAFRNEAHLRHVIDRIVALRRTGHAFLGLLGANSRHLARELDRGHPRSDAVGDVADQTPSDDLRAFVSAVQ